MSGTNGKNGKPDGTGSLSPTPTAEPLEMTSEEFRQWEDLPLKVVWNDFRWAMDGGGKFRSVDFDDLVQVANIGLVNAWVKYSPDHKSGARFITYAYYKIYWTLMEFVAGEFRLPDSVLESDINENWNENWNGGRDESREVADEIDDEDFTEVCIGKLKKRLGHKDYRVLVYHYLKGWSNKKIGGRFRCSEEHARQMVHIAKIRAAIALMEEDQG